MNILLEVENTGARENMTTNDDNTYSPVKPKIYDKFHVKEEALQDNLTQTEEEEHARKEKSNTDAIDTAAKITTIPDALCGPMTKDIRKEHGSTEDKEDQFETETIKVAI